MVAAYKTTADIQIPKNLVDQIIGQDEAVKTIKKAALQRRNVLLIGEPGTGKSLTGQALAELLPNENLVDIISLPNTTDENNPLIKEVPKGQGKEIVGKAKLQVMSSMKNQNIIFFILVILAMLSPWWIRKVYGDIIAAAAIISSMMFLASFVIFMSLNRKAKLNAVVPKLLIDNGDKKKAPFIEATGAHAGALLGDVLHDPLQSLGGSNKITSIITVGKNQTQIMEAPVTLIDQLLEENKQAIIKKEDYEAVFLPEKKMVVLGEKNKEAESVDVLSVNRYTSKNEYLIKVQSESGKELLVSPEHKVAIMRFGKIFYKEARKLTRFDKLLTIES